MVKVVNNSGQHKITIPKDIVEAKGWISKTRLRFIEDFKENIILKPVEGKGTKVVDNAGQHKITIPKDIIGDRNWSSETRLRFIEDIEGNIMLKEMKTTLK